MLVGPTSCAMAVPTSHGSAAKPCRKPERQVACADVIGDVALELGGGQPKAAIDRRNMVRGVVAEQQQAVSGRSGNPFK